MWFSRRAVTCVFLHMAEGVDSTLINNASDNDSIQSSNNFYSTKAKSKQKTNAEQLCLSQDTTISCKKKKIKWEAFLTLCAQGLKWLCSTMQYLQWCLLQLKSWNNKTRQTYTYLKIVRNFSNFQNVSWKYSLPLLFAFWRHGFKPWPDHKFQPN